MSSVFKGSDFFTVTGDLRIEPRTKSKTPVEKKVNEQKEEPIQLKGPPKSIGGGQPKSKEPARASGSKKEQTLYMSDEELNAELDKVLDELVAQKRKAKSGSKKA